MKEISVFGGTGFIGTRFCEMYPRETIKISRDSYIPKTNEILHFISTTHNYNVFENVFKDVDTNIIIDFNYYKR